MTEFEHDSEIFQNLPTTTLDLMDHPIESGPARDKVFGLAKFSREGSKSRIDIADDTPVAVLNESMAAELGLAGLPTVTEMRQRSKAEYSNLSLFSAGAFLWYSDQGTPTLISHRRISKSTIDAGQLTGPAGRCGEKPSETIRQEIAEELLVFVQDQGTHKLLAFIAEEDEIEDMTRIKTEQLQKALKYIENSQIPEDQEDAGLINEILAQGENGFVFVRMQTCLMPDYPEVSLTHGQETLDELNAWSYWDQDNNTLEIRQSFYIPEKYKVVSARAGDYNDSVGYYFDRAVAFTEEDIVPENFYETDGNDNSTVPAMTAYLRRKIAERRVHTDW